MPDEVLIVEKAAAGYAVVTLSRPHAMNALSLQLCNQLTQMLRELEADPAVRVLILTGAGRAFCAGLDMKELSEAASALLSQLGSQDDPARALQSPGRDPDPSISCNWPIAKPAQETRSCPDRADHRRILHAATCQGSSTTPSVMRTFRRYVQHFAIQGVEPGRLVYGPSPMGWETFADHWLDRFEDLGGKEPRYYQRNAINAVAKLWPDGAARLAADGKVRASGPTGTSKSVSAWRACKALGPQVIHHPRNDAAGWLKAPQLRLLPNPESVGPFLKSFGQDGRAF